MYMSFREALLFSCVRALATARPGGKLQGVPLRRASARRVCTLLDALFG